MNEPRKKLTVGEIIGLRLKAERIRAGLTLKDASARLSEPPDTIQRRESGENLAKAEHLDALEVAYAEILRGGLTINHTSGTMETLVGLPRARWIPDGSDLTFTRKDIEKTKALVAEHLDAATLADFRQAMDAEGISDPVERRKREIALAYLEWAKTCGVGAVVRAGAFIESGEFASFEPEE